MVSPKNQFNWMISVKISRIWLIPDNNIKIKIDPRQLRYRWLDLFHYFSITPCYDRNYENFSECVLSIPPWHDFLKESSWKIFNEFIHHFATVLESSDVLVSWTKFQYLNAPTMERDCRAIELILEREDLPTESFVCCDYEIKTKN